MSPLRRPFHRPPDCAIDRPRRRLITASAALLVAMTTGVSRADVVPPKAVEVADGWLALVDRGRNREAVAKYFDRTPPADGRAMVARLDHAPPRKLTRRSMTAWVGRGDGDMSRMMPGGYYAMVFDVVDASGLPSTDEVRMVPRGDAWRIVDYVRER